MADLAIDVSGLRQRLGGGGGAPAQEVVGGLDLAVDRGQLVSLVGPSGCGKSTVLRVLAGLLEPTGGKVTVGPAAFHPQRDLLLPWRRVTDNATLGAEVCGVPRAEARRRALAEMERFGLAGFERAWPAELSGGMRQRLALLRTFLMPRPVLLLDEPFGALDAITRRDLHTWLQEVLAADGRTVLLVTHDVDEALVLSDAVVVLSSRPAREVVRLEVDLPRPRDLATLTDPRFVAAKASLLTALESGRR